MKKESSCKDMIIMYSGQCTTETIKSGKTEVFTADIYEPLFESVGYSLIFSTYKVEPGAEFVLVNPTLDKSNRLAIKVAGDECVIVSQYELNELYKAIETKECSSTVVEDLLMLQCDGNIIVTDGEDILKSVLDGFMLHAIGLYPELGDHSS